MKKLDIKIHIYTKNLWANIVANVETQNITKKNAKNITIIVTTITNTLSNKTQRILTVPLNTSTKLTAEITKNKRNFQTKSEATTITSIP